MSITTEQLLIAFTAKYSPYLLKDYSFSERKPEDISVDEKHPELCVLVRNVDLKRKEDPFIGAKLAGQEIYLNLINWLKNEKGVHAETLLAVLGSVGGRECINGIMNTLHSIVTENLKEHLISIVVFYMSVCWDLLLPHKKLLSRLISYIKRNRSFNFS